MTRRRLGLALMLTGTFFVGYSCGHVMTDQGWRVASGIPQWFLGFSWAVAFAGLWAYLWRGPTE